MFYSIECATAIGSINNTVGAWLVWKANNPIRSEMVDGHKHYIITVPNETVYSFLRKRAA